MIVSLSSKILSAAALLIMLSAIHGREARAADDDPHKRDGTEIGIVAGVLPPPGVYGSLDTIHAGLTVKTSDGTDTSMKSTAHTLTTGLLWVPDITIFGAAYGIGVYQPLRAQSTSTPRGGDNQAGVTNTILNVSTLSWNLGRGLHASLGANLFLDDIAGANTGSFSLGRGYTTYEPRGSLTYVTGRWALTGSALLDLNTENKSTRYRCGTDLVLDVTALSYIDAWSYGLGTEILQQVSADRRNGLVVAAIPGGHSRGNRARDVSLGPVAGYDFGSFSVQAFGQMSLSAANVSAGWDAGLRVTVPIWTDRHHASLDLDAAGRR